jgi:hypothetical protein
MTLAVLVVIVGLVVIGLGLALERLAGRGRPKPPR